MVGNGDFVFVMTLATQCQTAIRKQRRHTLVCWKDRSPDAQHVSVRYTTIGDLNVEGWTWQSLVEWGISQEGGKRGRLACVGYTSKLLP